MRPQKCLFETSALNDTFRTRGSEPVGHNYSETPSNNEECLLNYHRLSDIYCNTLVLLFLIVRVYYHWHYSVLTHYKLLHF